MGGGEAGGVEGMRGMKSAMNKVDRGAVLKMMVLEVFGAAYMMQMLLPLSRI